MLSTTAFSREGIRGRRVNIRGHPPPDAIGESGADPPQTIAAAVGRVRASALVGGCVVPTADAVLAWAASVANEWRWLAIIWHVALAALLVAVSLARIQERVVARLLVLPIVSVAVLAWLSANPFNGLVFTAVGVLLLRSVKHLPRSAASRAPRGWRLDGWALVAFGWLYPHFLITDSWAAYAYASPFGLLPCPTLAVVVGVTLALGGLRSARWNTVVAAAAVLYGAIGVFRLGVILDVWLLVGGILLAATALPASRRSEESVMTRTAKRTAVGLGASFFVWLAIQAMPFGRPSANPSVVAEPAWDTAETRQAREASLLRLPQQRDPVAGIRERGSRVVADYA
jgi:hypothetical protein